MPTCVDKVGFEKLERDESDKNKVGKSFNKYSKLTISDKTKLIIVGTITPPDTPYFYCAPRNRIYGYIDKALTLNKKGNQAVLQELKKVLQIVNGVEYLSDIKEQAIKLIEQILNDHGIVFLDVMDKVIRKYPQSHDDESIEFYTLAKDEFNSIESFENVLIIVNSKLAKKCFEEMVPSLKVSYLPQRGRGSGSKRWVESIYNAIKKQDK